MMNGDPSGDTNVRGNDQAVATAADEDRTEEPNGEEDEFAALASPTGHNYLRDETVVTVGQGAGEEEEEECLVNVDEDGNPAHILDLVGHSVLSKEASALKHFDQFLAQFLLNSGRSPGRTHDQLLFDEIDSHMMGSFATYLLQKAKSHKAVSAQHLSGGHSPAAHSSYYTTVSYLSPVQTYYSRLFKRDFSDFSCFGSQWKKMLATLRAQFNNRVRIEGKRLVVPKAIGQQSNYLSIATLCIWDGRNEIAALRHQHISVVTKQEDFQRSYRMAQVELNNWKQGTCQDLHVLPHIDSWLMDFYFASAVFLSASGEALPYLCPSFAKTVVTYGTSNKTNTSGVSRYWSSCLAQLQKYHQSSTQHELMGDILIGIAARRGNLM